MPLCTAFANHLPNPTLDAFLNRWLLHAAATCVSELELSQQSALMDVILLKMQCPMLSWAWCMDNLTWCLVAVVYN